MRTPQPLAIPSPATLRRGIPVEIREPSGTDLSVSDSQPILDFIASDESLDRYDEIISVSGWRLDTYRRNPVFQNAHQYGDILFTLGRALITEIREVGRVTPCAPLSSSGGEGRGEEALTRSTLHAPLSTVLFQRIQFATDVNPIARIAYGLYKGKFLNAVSVGFIPLRWLDANGVEHSSTNEFQRFSVSASQRFESGFRRKYLEQELLEVSAVGIPANSNALALAFKSGAIQRSDVGEALDLLKSLCASRSSSAPRGLKPGRRDPQHQTSDQRPATHHLQLLSLARELRRILRQA